MRGRLRIQCFQSLARRDQGRREVKQLALLAGTVPRPSFPRTVGSLSGMRSSLLCGILSSATDSAWLSLKLLGDKFNSIVFFQLPLKDFLGVLYSSFGPGTFRFPPLPTAQDLWWHWCTQALDKDEKVCALGAEDPAECLRVFRIAVMGLVGPFLESFDLVLDPEDCPELTLDDVTP